MKYEDFAVRPLQADDQALLLRWRNSERVRVNMYTDHLISENEHAAWFSRALVDPAARYLVFSHLGRAVGFISFTGISTAHGRCTWAFYLGEEDAPRGSGSAMEFFALDYAFGTLGIRKLCCEVFVFNAGVIKLHEKFGFAHEGRMLAHYVKSGQGEDIVCLAKFGASWPAQREPFKSMCFRTSEK